MLIYIFVIEKGIRGGFSYFNKRHSKANTIVQIITKISLKMILVTLYILVTNYIVTLYMGVQLVNIYHMEDLNGLKLLMKQSIEY